jgi:hypothetical protein
MRRPAERGDSMSGVRRRARALLAGALMLPALALASCTDGGDANASANPSSTALTDLQIRAMVNDLVECIRQNGAPGMPDVEVRDGKVVEPDEAGVDEATKQNFDQALSACRALYERIPPSVFNDDQPQTETREEDGPGPEDVPALRAWAECIRQNGVPEWPDPKPDGSFPMAGSPLETEGKSPRILAAWEKCEQYWNGGIRGS